MLSDKIEIRRGEKKNRNIFTIQKNIDRTIRNAKKFDEHYFEEENYVYREWYRDQATIIVERMMRHIHPTKDWVFLDVGCALGGIVAELRERNFEAYGIDLSRWCLKQSPVREHLAFGSITSIPCTDQSADVVTCIDMFQYLTRKEMEKAAKELRRVTRRCLFLECITKEDEAFSDPKENPDSMRKNRSLLSERELLILFQKAGFRLKKQPFLPRIIRAKPYDHEFSFNAVFEVDTSC